MTRVSSILLTLLALVTMGVNSQTCDNIWTQGLRANSQVPATINVPAPNPVFPEPLQPIDYYFSDNASYTISNNSVRTTVGATARLFFNGDLTVGSNVQLNAGGPSENFILVVTGNLTLGANSIINGYILAGGSINFNNSVAINGAVTAKGGFSGFVPMVSYNAAGLTRLQGGTLCDTAVASAQIDHFEFYYSGQALSCKPETIIVRACQNASCSQLVSDNVTATLSPASSGNLSWTGGNTISFSGGQTSVSLRYTVAGNITIGISDASPVPSGQTLCRAGSGALSAAACTMSFADSGLIFDIADGIANLAQTNIVLSAVRKDDNSQQCVPEFTNVSRDIAFWSDYITPDASGRVASFAVTVNDQAVAGQQATALAQTLNFNSQGQASITVNYADAGLMQLNASYTGSGATNDSGLQLLGSEQFIRRPQALCLRTAAACAAADSSCSAFAVAGQPFALNITAHQFQAGSTDQCANPVTPSFSHHDIALSHSVLAPAAGVSGSLGVTSYQHLASASGETTIQQTVSEVGVFQISTAPVNYLGMADAIPAAFSPPVGRFIPHRFSITAGTVVAACGSFSYFGQPSFSTAFTLQALNSTGQLTQNYQHDFARLDVSQWNDTSATEGMRYSAPLLSDGASLQAGTVAPIGNWANGEAAMLVAHYASRPNNPAAPLALNVYALPRDSDNVSMAGAALLHSNPTELRFGRLLLKNAAGPEEENLPLALATEYWNGSRFIGNSADNCTLIGNSPALLTTQQGTPDLTLGGSGGTVQQGQFPASSLWLNTPGSTGNWLIEYQAEPWLQYYWRGAGVNYQQNPSAEIMFGRYRGNPRQISWREVFQ